MKTQWAVQCSLSLLQCRLPTAVAAYARSRQAAAFSGENNNLLKRFPTKVAGSNSLCAAQTQSHNHDARKAGNRNTIAHRLVAEPFQLSQLH